MTVLVTGVRGSIGRQVADLLHLEGAGVRGASARADHVQAATFPVVQLDLRDPARLSGALEGVDAVFLYAAHDAIDEVARIMADHGVQHVVVLSSASVETPGAEALAEHHRRVEDAVTAAGLPWTFLRPGAFASNTVAWAGALQTGQIAMPYPDAYVEPIHEADIADAAVFLLRQPHNADRSYFLTGGQSLTQREQVQAIASAVRRDIVVDTLPPEQWAEQVADFMPASAAQSLLQMWHNADGHPGRIDGTIRDITGAEPRRFSQWVDDHLSDFR